MKVEYINPFITAASQAFQTMLGHEIRRGVPVLKEDADLQFEISGVIGLSGSAVGTVVLSFSENVALQAAGTMLMMEMTEINADVIDAVGELTNMVAGAAKAQLEHLQLSISLPNVITGKGHEVRFPSNVRPIVIPFDSDWGPLTLEVGLSDVPAAVLV
ncbi:MAG: chemotaxis protein CheX [Planctomycetales bacterium]|jgi:chemotaxis protein CheX|nr:chemotaxis protein CheX [Planctomycetales bacterium]